jgi:hypothetical protein
MRTFRASCLESQSKANSTMVVEVRSASSARRDPKATTSEVVAG